MEIYLEWEAIKDQVEMENIFSLRKTKSEIECFLKEANLVNVEKLNRGRNYTFRYEGKEYLFTVETVNKDNIEKRCVSSICKKTFEKYKNDSWKIGKYVEILDQRANVSV